MVAEDADASEFKIFAGESGGEVDAWRFEANFFKESRCVDDDAASISRFATNGGGECDSAG